MHPRVELPGRALVPSLGSPVAQEPASRAHSREAAMVLPHEHTQTGFSRRESCRRKS